MDTILQLYSQDATGTVLREYFEDADTTLESVDHVNCILTSPCIFDASQAPGRKLLFYQENSHTTNAILSRLPLDFQPRGRKLERVGIPWNT